MSRSYTKLLALYISHDRDFDQFINIIYSCLWIINFENLSNLVLAEPNSASCGESTCIDVAIVSHSHGVMWSTRHLFELDFIRYRHGDGHWICNEGQPSFLFGYYSILNLHIFIIIISSWRLGTWVRLIWHRSLIRRRRRPHLVKPLHLIDAFNALAQLAAQAGTPWEQATICLDSYAVWDTVGHVTPIGQHIGIHKLYLFIKLIDLSCMLFGRRIIILALVWIAC